MGLDEGAVRNSKDSRIVIAIRNRRGCPVAHAEPVISRRVQIPRRAASVGADAKVRLKMIRSLVFMGWLSELS